jgi:hypothetical protein
MQVSGAPHSLHLTSNLYVVPVVPSAPPTKNLAHRAPIERAVVQDLKSSGSVRCIKHNNPDHRDKSEAHKRGQRHELLPVGVMDRATQFICDGRHIALPGSVLCYCCTVVPGGAVN